MLWQWRARMDLLQDGVAGARCQTPGYSHRQSHLQPYQATQPDLVQPTVSKPGHHTVNLSSAAQSPVNLEALAGRAKVSDQLNAYTQSKEAALFEDRGVNGAPRTTQPKSP